MTRTALVPEPQPLWPALILSLGAHMLVGGIYVLSVLVMAYLGPSKPILVEQDTIQVSLLAKSDLPTKAMRAAPPKGAPTPPPKPVETAPPPVQSDLAIQTEEAPPEEQGTAEARKH